MTREEDLEARVEMLEQQLAYQRAVTRKRTVRKRSALTLFGLPLYEIATGPDPDAGELRGHARAIIAIGDIATGVIAFGGFARGIIAVGGGAIGGVAVGGFAAGVVAIGGTSLGIAAALGGIAIGAFAAGGIAVGKVALGGLRIPL